MMAQFTRKAIEATFQGMLEEMPFDKITVSAIVKRCEISSNTFYYHFRDIYDLLDDWLKITWNKYMNNSEYSWGEAAKTLLRACQKNKNIVYHLSNSIQRERLEQYFFSRSNDFISEYVRESANSRKISEKKIDNVAEFCRYAIMGFFLKFLWSQMNEDVDEAVDNLTEMLYAFIGSALDD